ncbi:hypothetical protein BJ742DRAFT_786151 [Cladochytrium replicatum]|nr:hypothetical protein BJ742DRAFT_786151 [Cladochytrium replicatum]
MQKSGFFGDDRNGAAQLLPMFPDIEPAAISATLHSCDGDLDRTIQALLDGNFPPIATGEPQTFSSLTIQQKRKREPSPKASTSNESCQSPKHFPIFTNPQGTSFSSKKKPTQKRSAIPPVVLTPSNLSDHLPCEITLDFLPQELATSLVTLMLTESKSFPIPRYFIFEREVTSPHRSQLYTEDIESAHFYQGRRSDQRQSPTLMIQAARDIEDHVNARLAEHLTHPDTWKWGPARTFEVRPGDWKSNVVVANLYSTAENAVGPHSDALTMLGPRPVIASLTLGATRPFRFRKVPLPSDTQTFTYDVNLPHNSLCIMFPPCQEQYRHSVPKVKSTQVKPHPLCGPARINLTFRMARKPPENVPKCHCGRPAEMRTVQRDDTSENYGKYFWSCTGGAEGDDEVGRLSDDQARTSTGPVVRCKFFKWEELDYKDVMVGEP